MNMSTRRHFSLASVLAFTLAAGAAGAQETPRTLRIGVLNSTPPLTRQAFDQFARDVSRATAGTLRVEFLSVPDPEIVGTTTFRSTVFNRLDGVFTAAGWSTHLCSGARALQAPALFANTADFDRVLSAVRTELDSTCEGYTPLAWYDAGQRTFFSRRHSANPSDFATEGPLNFGPDDFMAYRILERRLTPTLALISPADMGVGSRYGDLFRGASLLNLPMGQSPEVLAMRTQAFGSLTGDQQRSVTAIATAVAAQHTRRLRAERERALGSPRLGFRVSPQLTAPAWTNYMNVVRSQLTTQVPLMARVVQLLRPTP